MVFKWKLFLNWGKRPIFTYVKQLIAEILHFENVKFNNVGSVGSKGIPYLNM